jgi:hypothetical protein
MNCKSITFIIVMFVLLLSSSGIHATLKTNLSLKATASASYTTDGYDAAYVNDNNTTTIWENYRGEQYYNTWNYVELDWEYSHQIINSKIIWYVNGNVQLPTEVYLAYWDGHQWVKAKDITVSRTSSQTDTIYSNKVRLYIKGASAIGLTEFYVYGYETTSCTAATLTAQYSKNGGSNVSNTNVELNDNEVVTLCPLLTLPDGEEETAVWNWSGPDVTAITPTITLTKSSRSGLYTATYMRQCGKETSVKYAVSINGSVDPETGYLWPSYSPKLDYNFRQEFPALKAPTKLLPENVNMKGYKADGWWAIRWGPKTRSLVTDTAKALILKKMNTDFAYFRDVMGWPPDKRAKNGYYSTIDVYGSGLITDGEDSTALGGWQSATGYNGESWPNVLLSYYPIYSFDPRCTYSDKVSQQNACVHEGIHAVLADLPGCKQSAWFQEGGNTWLQGQAYAQQNNDFSSLGFLDAAAIIAPFMPIECYSGWLQDDSFGGPSAEGVNMNGSDGKQICTWRNLLGGVQYANNWPIFLGENLGLGSVPWIWRYCSGRVLEGMADSLGEMQMRHLIVEYRTKQATLDMGKWTSALKSLLNNNFQSNIASEWTPTWKTPAVWKATPYAIMTALSGDSTGWYKPEYRTTPGWSGANQIPIHVRGNKGDSVSVDFLPIGKNMVCQLCYRTKVGQAYYSRPVSSGTCSMIIPDVPANNVVFAVVTNTDYIYYGEQTRKTHYDYRLRMGSNAWGPASSAYKWYDWTLTLKDATFNYTTVKATDAGSNFSISLTENVINSGDDVMLSVSGSHPSIFPVLLFGSNGQLIYQQNFTESGMYHFPGGLTSGVHLLQAINGNQQQTIKVFVR